MARIQFDKEKVLESATNAFWRLGYTATSMHTLVEQTGLKPGSIYLAFGNKEGLFRESLDYYAHQSLDNLEATLAQYNSVEEALPDIFMSFIEESCQSEYCSCFLVKSQLELTDQQTELRDHVSQQLRRVESLYFESFLKNNTESEARAKATSVMLHIFGIRVYGYHSNSKEQLIDALRLGLPWLSWKAEH
ncbi:TetR family transcriptional regulator [Marinomonas ushuaiensis DSM 15871]|uniref:TetR family transcriptional regulator n=1 Tax=Marinomonas ushuaiensis DSM 15871 TaxID=1122207 RepID=X7E5A2_9GAMM|nr:TetR/AcrR family transcriptional regulator [Marinomonas ushuaiensis]ETX11137.1 TetR family transcriptional regulator [Marinomonas ushuaiensis DSM 15871]